MTQKSSKTILVLELYLTHRSLNVLIVFVGEFEVVSTFKETTSTFSSSILHPIRMISFLLSFKTKLCVRRNFLIIFMYFSMSCKELFKSLGVGEKEIQAKSSSAYPQRVF